MAPRSHSIRWLIPLTLTVLLAEARPSHAQTLNEGWNVLEDRFDKERRRIATFLKGTERVDPNDKGQVEAIDLLAKTYTYGIYLQKLDTQPTPPGRESPMSRDYQDFLRDLNSIFKAKDAQTMQPFAEVLRDKVRIHAWEVLEFDQAKPIHKVHNARLLAKIAELGQPELADTLIKALKDPKQNDGVRFYVLRGLRKLLAFVRPPDMTPVLTKAQQTSCAEAIVEFLEKRKGPAKNASPEEIDGFRLLRREAIRSLSQIHMPSVNDKVRPALVLARFAGNDEGIKPPPRIDERVEAALGLARMKSAQDKQYQPDYAAGAIAKCLGAFAQMYDKERARFKTNKEKEMQTRPWAIDAVMLKDALAALKSDSGKNAYVAKMTSRGMGVMDSIIKGIDIGGNELTWWSTEQSDPPSKELFQGAADSVVKPAPPAEPEPEK